MRTTSKAEIKAWLKAIKKNRAWLAAQMAMTQGSVNQLLDSKRPISGRAALMLDQLLQKYPAASAAAGELPAPVAAPAENVLVLSVPPADFAAWNKAALETGQLVADWAVAVLNEAAASLE